MNFHSGENNARTLHKTKTRAIQTKMKIRYKIEEHEHGDELVIIGNDGRKISTIARSAVVDEFTSLVHIKSSDSTYRAKSCHDFAGWLGGLDGEMLATERFNGDRYSVIVSDYEIAYAIKTPSGLCPTVFRSINQDRQQPMVLPSIEIAADFIRSRLTGN